MQQLVTIDLACLFWFQSLHNPWTDPLMKSISHLGDQAMLSGVMVGTFLFCLRVKAMRTGMLLLLVYVGGLCLTEAVKILVVRPRPDVANALVEPSRSGSFPSGHAVLSLVVYGSIAVALGRRLRSRGARALL